MSDNSVFYVQTETTLCTTKAEFIDSAKAREQLFQYSNWSKARDSRAQRRRDERPSRNKVQIG